MELETSQATLELSFSSIREAWDVLNVPFGLPPRRFDRFADAWRPGRDRARRSR